MSINPLPFIRNHRHKDNIELALDKKDLTDNGKNASKSNFYVREAEMTGLLDEKRDKLSKSKYQILLSMCQNASLQKDPNMYKIMRLQFENLLKQQ
jgi:hypothetical protein